VRIPLLVTEFLIMSYLTEPLRMILVLTLVYVVVPFVQILAIVTILFLILAGLSTAALFLFILIAYFLDTEKNLFKNVK
jgi:hypothetical protein